MKKKIVFFDIDGTLLKSNQELVDTDVIESVNMLRDNGFKVCLCTGRSLGQAKLIKEQLKLGDGIFSNGQTILKNDEFILNNHLPEDNVAEVFKLAKANKVFVATIENTGMFLNRGIKDYILKHKLRKFAFGGIKQKKLTTENVQGFWLFAKGEQITQIEPKINTKIYEVFKYGDTTLEVLPKEFSKASGINYFQEQLEHEVMTIGIGDGRNDIPMFNAVDYKIAMGNANDTLKSTADFITTKNDEDGIVNAIEHIIKNIK